MKQRLPFIFRSALVLFASALLWTSCAVEQSEKSANEKKAPAAATEPVTSEATDKTATETSSKDNSKPKVDLSFGLHKIKALQKPLWGNPRWQYVASLLYIILAFYASKLLDWLTRVWLKKWADKTASKLDDILLELLHGPIKVVVFVVLLHIGLNVFEWPNWAEEVLSKGLKIIVAVSLTYLVMKAVDLLLNYWRVRATEGEDKAFDDQLYPVIRKSLKVFVGVVAVLVTCQNLGLNITSVIALGSVGGLAVGLAAQDTLANLFGAVAVFVDKPFRVGDRIKLPDVDGTVEAIGLRSTRVRNLDGHLITIPNKTVGGATITNITKRPNIKTTMNISITYDTPTTKVQRALDILDDIFRKHPMTHDVWISFNQFADSSLNIMVIHWWNGTVYKDFLVGIQEMNLEVKKRFDAEGIQFAFPTRTLYVKQDSKWQVEPPKEQGPQESRAA